MCDGNDTLRMYLFEKLIYLKLILFVIRFKLRYIRLYTFEKCMCVKANNELLYIHDQIGGITGIGCAYLQNLLEVSY